MSYAGFEHCPSRLEEQNRIEAQATLNEKTPKARGDKESLYVRYTALVRLASDGKRGKTTNRHRKTVYQPTTTLAEYIYDGGKEERWKSVPYKHDCQRLE